MLVQTYWQLLSNNQVKPIIVREIIGKKLLSLCLNLCALDVFNIQCTIPLYLSNGAYYQQKLGFSGCNYAC